jgi:hypothetical protein
MWPIERVETLDRMNRIYRMREKRLSVFSLTILFILFILSGLPATAPCSSMRLTKCHWGLSPFFGRSFLAALPIAQEAS